MRGLSWFYAQVGGAPMKKGRSICLTTGLAVHPDWEVVGSILGWVEPKTVKTSPCLAISIMVGQPMIPLLLTGFSGEQSNVEDRFHILLGRDNQREINL